MAIAGRRTNKGAWQAGTTDEIEKLAEIPRRKERPRWQLLKMKKDGLDPSYTGFRKGGGMQTKDWGRKTARSKARR